MKKFFRAVHLKAKEWKYTDVLRLGCMLKEPQVVKISPKLTPLRGPPSSLHWCSFRDVNLVIFKYLKFIDQMFVARVRRCTGCYLMQRPMYPQNWLFDNMATAVWPARMWNHSLCFPDCHGLFFSFRFVPWRAWTNMMSFCGVNGMLVCSWHHCWFIARKC